MIKPRLDPGHSELVQLVQLQWMPAHFLQGNLRGDLARGYCPTVCPMVAAFKFATSFVAILGFKSLLVA